MKSSTFLKSFLAIAVCIAAVHTADAQLMPKFGVKGGLNIANISNVDGAESRTGFLAGIYARLSIPASPIEIQPEILYAQYGADGDGGSFELDYFQIPVLARFGFDLPASPVTPSVFLGPYFAVNMRAEAGNGGNTVDVDDLVKDTDFGGVVGAAVDFSRFTLGVRYTFGFTEIFESAANPDGERNSAIGITLGVGLN